MRLQRSTRSRRVVASAVVAAIMLAGCSGDDDNSSSSTAGTQPDESTSVDTEPTDTAAPDTEVPDTEAPGPTGDPGFVFGYLRPPTGIQTQLALAQETAMQLAVDDINAAGGVNGGPAELIVVDEPADGDTAAAITQLVDEGADMVLGPVSSTSSLAALPALGTAGSVACSASATAPELSSLDTEGVLYRTAMPDTYTVAYVAEQITADQAAASLPEGQPYKVSILARQDDYGIGVGNGLASALTARGMDVQVIPYTPRRVIFTEEAAQIAGFAPNAVVLVSYAEAVRQVSALVTAGVAASSIIGLDGAFSPNLATGAFPTDPAQADGLRVIGSTGDRAFIDRLLAAESLDQLIFGAQMYDCVMVGALAAQQAGSSDIAAFGPQITAVTVDGRSCSTVDDCFSKIAAGEEIDYEGVSGGIRFNEYGDPSEVRITVAQFNGGDLGELRSDDLNLDDLRQQEALAAAIFTTQVQQLLTILGFYSGPIDGQESDELTASIALFQQNLGVPVTGVWDAETDAAAREKYGSLMAGLSGSVIGIQQLLSDLGYYAGPIDGVLSQATVDAIKAFQADLGVPQTGVIDAATLVAAFQAGVTVGTPTTTVPPATTAPPDTTTAPTTTAAPPPATTTTVPPPITPPTTSVPIVPPDPTEPTILQALRADPRFSEFVKLIEAAGFPADFGQTIGTITVFAPTNDALAAVDPAVLDQLRSDPELLQWYLSYTVVQGDIPLESLATFQSIQSLLGEFIPITVDAGGTVFVDGVATIPPRIDALNGGIIPVAGVLIPEATPG